MAIPYQKLEVKKFPKRIISETKESKFWKKYEVVYDQTENGAITNVQGSNDKHLFAYVHSNVVDIYDCKKNKPKTKITKFRSDDVTAIKFRNDGKLLATGETSGYIQIFDVKRKVALRGYQKHTKAVHALEFIPAKASLISGSDDLSVKVFDIQTNTITRSFGNIHNDYIRSVVGVPDEPDLILSTSYDSKIHLLDTRAADKKPLATWDHTSPIEDIDIFADGQAFITVGSTLTTMWDRRNTSYLTSFNTNLKMVTSVKIFSSVKKFMTGSLDQHLKIYSCESSNAKLIHQLKYPAGIMSFDVTTNLSHLAVGMNDGHVLIKSKGIRQNAQKEEDEETKPEYQIPKIDSTDKYIVRDRRFFTRGIYETPENYDIEYEGQKKLRLQEFDKYLKKFQYQNALKAAFETKNLDIIYTLLEELIQRDALTKSFRSNNEEDIIIVFDYLIMAISNPRYTNIIVNLAYKLIDDYSSQLFENDLIKESFIKLYEKVENEVNEQKDMLNILGKIDMIMDANAF